MENTFLFNFGIGVVFIGSIFLVCSDILIKIDPELTNLLNKTVVEKELFNAKLTIFTFNIIFLVEIIMLEFDSIFYVSSLNYSHWNSLLIFWLSFFFFIFFNAAYWYYTAIGKLLSFYRFLPLKHLPTLNIYKLLPSEYFIFVGFLFIFLVNLITVKNIITFYLYFEITNICVYCLLGMSKNSPKAAEAAVKYYFISFLSSVFCLWGVSYFYGFLGVSDYKIIAVLLYNANFSNLSCHSNILYATILIVSGFCIKLGIFPYHIWVPTIYERLGHFNFLLVSVLVKLGIYFAFLNFILEILIKPQFSTAFFNQLFLLSGVGSAICGSFFLITRNSVRSFIAANSLISWGILCLNLGVLFRNGLSWEDRTNLLQINLQYLIVYLFLLVITYIIWLNWYIYIYWHRILNFFYYKFNFIFNMSNLFKKFWLEYFKVSPFIKNTVHQINYLTTLHYLFNQYKDTQAIFFLWIIAGFPPFLLFITKFYIIYYSWIFGATYSSIIIWFVLSSLGVYGYIRCFSLIIARFRKIL